MVEDMLTYIFIDTIHSPESTRTFWMELTFILASIKLGKDLGIQDSAKMIKELWEQYQLEDILDDDEY